MATLLLLIASCSSCAGTKARETVLMPALLQAWTATINKQVEAAAVANAVPLFTPEQVRALGAALVSALESGDRSIARTVDWSALRQAALIGIQLRVKNNEIGPGVALSIVETVRLFDQDWTTLLSR